jgi:hypothetical protein
MTAANGVDAFTTSQTPTIQRGIIIFGKGLARSGRVALKRGDKGGIVAQLSNSAAAAIFKLQKSKVVVVADVNRRR